MSGIHNSTHDVDIALGRLLASLAANWLRILVVSIVVTGVVLAFTRLATPLYKGETRLLIEAREPLSAQPEVNGGRDRPVVDDETVASQAEVISSTDMLRQVARKLELSARPEFDQAAETSALVRLLVKAGLLSDPAELSPEERVLKAMRQKLSAYRVGNSRVIVIEFSSQDRRLAAEIPNGLADATIAAQREAELESKPEIAGLHTPEREAAQQRDTLPVDTRVLSRAAPTEPRFPKTLPIAGASFAASLLIMAIITLLGELFSPRTMRPATGAKPEPIAEVAMPESAAARAGEDAPSGPPHSDLPREPILLPDRGEVNVEMAAERLVTSGTARAIFISPQGDEAAATAVLVAREVADSGLRVLLLDLTSTGAASRPMLESRFQPGITNLLASEAQFSQVIHADRYSDCHVIPQGTADPERAMRAADRLPIIMNSLTTAYDVVVVECGPADAEGIRRLVSDGTEILVSVLEAEDAAIAEATADLTAAGYGNLTLVSPAGYEPPVSPVPNRSAA